ncbi:MAG: 2,3-dihydroxybiphenyl 1,2-dioxygenase [Myxococcota bacterium]|jgi:2,3-dihydroxybiphenyl 1,2-dioxygenase
MPTLGYLGFGVTDFDAWERFGSGVLGLTLGRTLPDGGFSLRMDGHAERFHIVPGPDDLAHIGWDCGDAEGLAAVASRLEAAGVTVTEDAGLAADRRVEALLRCEDPDGVPTELYYGPTLAEDAFVSPVVTSKFVADALGLGHIVLSSSDNVASSKFYVDLLGFLLSDHIVCEFYGHPVSLAFFHAPSSPQAPSRHHTVAFGGPQRKRLHHFMVEVADLEDVGMAYDRAIRARVPIMQTLGRHPNDRMLSFYAATPSKFQFEFGWGGRLVDDTDWSTTTYDRISDWGHHPPAVVVPRRKK